MADEALTGFLDFYNPLVLSIRERVAWFPMPTFTFSVWLAGLVILIVVLACLGPIVRRGAFGTRALSYFFSLLMLLNGLGHLTGSLYFGRWLPGTTTAPLLLAASVMLAVRASKRRREELRVPRTLAFAAGAGARAACRSGRRTSKCPREDLVRDLVYNWRVGPRRTKTVNIHEAKTHFSKLLQRVARGDEVVIARAGKPIARLLPFEAKRERPIFGIDRGRFTVPDDFDDPLPDDLLAEFERDL